MQLAKPLKLNPRQVAESLRAALLAHAAVSAWVDAIEIAGPGFINIRLKPAAKQQIVREVLAAGAALRHAAGQRPAHDGRVRLGQPDRPAARGPRPPGRAGRRDLQPVRRPRAGTCTASSITTTPACRSTRWPTARSCAPRASSRATPSGPKPPTTATTSPTSPPTSWPRRRCKSDDREFTASGDVDDLDGIRQFAVAYLRHEQDLDLQGLRGEVRQLLPRVQPVHQRPGRRRGAEAARGRQDLRAGRRAVAQVHRLRRRQGPRHAQGRRQLHLLRARRGLPHQPSGSAASRKVVNIQGTDHHGTIARVRAGLQAAGVGIPQGYPDYVLHTMVRVVRGGEEVKISKRAGSYVTLRDLIEWTSKDAVRFFLLSRKPDTEYTFDVDLARGQEQRQPGVLRAVRPCAHLLGAGGLGRRRGHAATDVDLSALDSPQAPGADAAAGQVPRHADAPPPRTSRRTT